jgi:hypothetical protein
MTVMILAVAAWGEDSSHRSSSLCYAHRKTPEGESAYRLPPAQFGPLFVSKMTVETVKTPSFAQEAGLTCMYGIAIQGQRVAGLTQNEVEKLLVEPGRTRSCCSSDARGGRSRRKSEFRCDHHKPWGQGMATRRCRFAVFQSPRRPASMDTFAPRAPGDRESLAEDF